MVALAGLLAAPLIGVAVRKLADRHSRSSLEYGLENGAVSDAARGAESAGNSLGVREHLESVVARDADKGDADRLGIAHRQGRRRRDTDQDRHPHHSSLLHQLDRDAARQHDEAGIGWTGRLQQRIGKFVERVVPADILAHDQIMARLPECRGMDRAGLALGRAAARRRPP